MHELGKSSSFPTPHRLMYMVFSVTECILILSVSHTHTHTKLVTRNFILSEKKMGGECIYLNILLLELDCEFIVHLLYHSSNLIIGALAYNYITVIQFSSCFLFCNFLH